MKWIIILATVLSCTNQLALADQDMPLGDSNPATGLRSATTLESAAGSDSEAPAVAARPRSKPKSTAMPKGTDYQPAQDLLLSAMSLIGVKYTWGGNTPEAGLDCSGFIKYVFQNSMNITLPRTALGMSQTGQNVDKSELKPGDLVFFNTLGRTFSHVGIYLGDNRFIHSPRSGRNIEVANMNLSYWQSRFNGARRVADSGSQGLNVSSLLAAGGGNKTSSTSARNNVDDSDAARSSMQCKKVTVGKGKKKKTVTQCTQLKPKNNAEPNKASRSKSSAKASKNKSTRKDTARAKPTSTKKVSKSKKKS